VDCVEGKGREGIEEGRGWIVEKGKGGDRGGKGGDCGEGKGRG